MPALTSSLTSFITLGDWGGMSLGSYHSTTVTKVAEQMAATAKTAAIPFLVNTGDNFYYCGITSTSDSQIATDFTGPYGKYSSLNVPWFSVLGNHEYGYSVPAQIELASKSIAPKWVMDDRYFTKRIAVGPDHISFIFIDTNPCVSACAPRHAALCPSHVVELQPTQTVRLAWPTRRDNLACVVQTARTTSRAGIRAAPSFRPVLRTTRAHASSTRTSSRSLAATSSRGSRRRSPRCPRMIGSSSSVTTPRTRST